MILLNGFSIPLIAQNLIGIQDKAIESSAVLEFNTRNQGVLFPRVDSVYLNNRYYTATFPNGTLLFNRNLKNYVNYPNDQVFLSSAHPSLRNIDSLIQIASILNKNGTNSLSSAGDVNSSLLNIIHQDASSLSPIYGLTSIRPNIRNDPQNQAYKFRNYLGKSLSTNESAVWGMDVNSNFSGYSAEEFIGSNNQEYYFGFSKNWSIDSVSKVLVVQNRLENEVNKVKIGIGVDSAETAIHINGPIKVTNPNTVSSGNILMVKPDGNLKQVHKDSIAIFLGRDFDNNLGKVVFNTNYSNSHSLYLNITYVQPDLRGIRAPDIFINDPQPNGLYLNYRRMNAVDGPLGTENPPFNDPINRADFYKFEVANHSNLGINKVGINSNSLRFSGKKYQIQFNISTPDITNKNGFHSTPDVLVKDYQVDLYLVPENRTSYNANDSQPKKTIKYSFFVCFEEPSCKVFGQLSPRTITTPFIDFYPDPNTDYKAVISLSDDLPPQNVTQSRVQLYTFNGSSDTFGYVRIANATFFPISYADMRIIRVY